MLPKRSDLPFWLSVAATALLMFVAPQSRTRQRREPWKGSVGKERPFGKSQSAEEPHELELPGRKSTAAAAKLSTRCKSLGAAGMTSSGAPIVR